MSLLNSIAMKLCSVTSSYKLSSGLESEATLLQSENITNFAQIAIGFSKIMKQVVGPVMIVIGAALAIYMIYLGVMYAKAEDANKRKDMVGRLVGVGVGLIIVLVGITLCYAINWVELYANMTGHRHAFEASENFVEYCKHCGQRQTSIIHSTT